MLLSSAPGPRGWLPPSVSSRSVADISVVVVEKGSEVGAHILSGVVFDPSAIDRLLPEWRDDPEKPLKTEVTDDRFYCLTESGAIAASAEFDAAADEQSR